MSLDLTRMTAQDMSHLREELTARLRTAPTLESAARLLCAHFRDELVGPSDERACILARCFSTLRYDQLTEDLQRIAKRALGAVSITPPEPGMRCLTLLATAGDEADWNDRRSSRGHQAIPLPSPYVVERAPMIARLIHQLGLDVAAVVRPDDATEPAGPPREGVFHVDEAAGSRYIPAQQGFVDRYGVRSVIGFGSVLSSGELFASILFTRVHIPVHVADRFGPLSLALMKVLDPVAHLALETAAGAT